MTHASTTIVAEEIRKILAADASDFNLRRLRAASGADQPLLCRLFVCRTRTPFVGCFADDWLLGCEGFELFSSHWHFIDPSKGYRLVYKICLLYGP